MRPAPNGSAKKQYEESLAKSKRFSQGVLKAPMTRFEATAAYWTMYIPSITFDIGSNPDGPGSTRQHSEAADARHPSKDGI